MNLTQADLDRIRDYTGTQPDDNTLHTIAVDATWWQQIAHRVLVRRRADAAAGGQETRSFSLDGVLSVGFSAADFRSLNLAIEDLETQILALTGTPTTQVGRITRPDRYR